MRFRSLRLCRCSLTARRVMNSSRHSRRSRLVVRFSCHSTTTAFRRGSDGAPIASASPGSSIFNDVYCGHLLLRRTCERRKFLFCQIGDSGPKLGEKCALVLARRFEQLARLNELFQLLVTDSSEIVDGSIRDTAPALEPHVGQHLLCG